MHRSPLTISLLFIVAGTLGCKTSPWSSPSASPPPSPVTALPVPTTAQAAMSPQPSATPPATASAANPIAPVLVPPVRTDNQSIESILAEIRKSHSLDAATEAELVHNLQSTPPSLWPLVVQQFRAALGYRRQAEQRQEASTSPSRQEASTSPPRQEASPPPQRQETSPPSSTAQAKPSKPPADPPSSPTLTKAPAASSEPPSKTSPVVNQDVAIASYETRPAGDWRRALEETIRLLEAKAASSPQSSEEFADHTRLRLLALAAGRRDEALRPIPSMAPPMQDFWSKEFCGLAVLLDPQHNPEPTRRAGEAQQHLAAAAQRLGESAPLAVRNLTFVTDVQSYGAFKAFEKYEFRPGQRVLLYAEVENFKVKETPRGFHTALQSSYQILDSRGQRVTEHDFSTNEEHCQNPRRDFFIGYEFILPKQIYPGKHTLQLTVTDLNADKIGQSTIDFTILAVE